MLNGNGLRVVLWVSGCNHHCKGCQNPITWNPDDGIEFGVPALAEICNELEKDYVSGFTFSGGDPLYPDNREMVAFIIDFIKAIYPDKDIWIYTGYTYEELEDQMIKGDSDLSDILTETDVLVDGPFISELSDTKLKWRGSSNQRVINMRDTLDTGKVNLFCE